MLRPGEVFADYLIERPLGSGGMAEVYLARHPRLPRQVALKLLSSEFYADPDIRARFEREANLVARLDHPNIVAVYDRGIWNDRLWMSMQFIDGTDAGTLDHRTLPPDRALHIIAETAKALDYAHTVGILHRDVKPANIMLARPSPGHGARVLLTDFGIGRLREETQHLTRTGALLATLAYASPEQLSGAPLDPRSDQYSLACTLFRLLSGSTPFEADSIGTLIIGHLQTPPPSVCDRRPGLPRAVDGVFWQALAKNPADRFGSCMALASAAAVALTPTATTVFVPGPANIGTAATAAQSIPANLGRPPAVRTMPGPGSGPSSANPAGRWLAAGILGLVVVLAVAGGIYWSTRDRGAPGATAPNTSTTTGSPTAAATLAAGTRLSMFPQFQPLMLVDEQGKQVTPPAFAVDPAGDGKAVCAPTTIATIGPFSGQNQSLGQSIPGGVKLAIDQFNRKNPGCQVSLKEFDTTSEVRVAAELAPQIASDSAIAAVIGPVFSGEALAFGNALGDADLAFLSPGASNATLSDRGFRGFFRGVSSDDIQGPAIARYLTGAAGFDRVCVVTDTSPYGSGLGRTLSAALGAAADGTCSTSVAEGADLAGAVSKIATARPDAVFYGGYNPDAANLVELLRAAGVTATFVSGDGAYDPVLVEGAGAAAAGAILSCLCGPPTDWFAEAFETVAGRPPGTFSVEAYDLTAIVLRGIAAGHVARADIVSYLRAYNGEGLAHGYQWNDKGELTPARLWLYKVP
ncbi:bifunctional serine/threonine-protein kinase/ABC transporter substrate-binding protein [Nocardia sp. NPDC127526]|uniref:bifunctional serine/threonine-protein kinase/ABC transporter substrate-binding protein n=1 Tax=Nocardia sp. NPDC127526 TaxID=3345393 RepID=UPI00363B9CA7